MTLRTAIIYPDEEGSPKVLAQSLQAMLRSLRVDTIMCPDGDRMLQRINRHGDCSTPHEDDNDLIARLADCTVVVVCSWCPKAFERRNYGVEELRRLLPGIPIALYLVYYVDNISYWVKRLADAGQPGSERYDWHLSASNYYPFEPARDRRWSHIGLNLAHTGMSPVGRHEFSVLVDFPREQTANNHHEQLEMLTEGGYPYRVLEGHYTMETIREIYREASVYLPQFHESFGIPVSEVLAMGGVVMVPDPEWLPAYRLDKSPLAMSTPILADTILVYRDRTEFRRNLAVVRDNHDPFKVAESFKETYPHYWEGRLDALEEFIHRIANGDIRAKE